MQWLFGALATALVVAPFYVFYLLKQFRSFQRKHEPLDAQAGKWPRRWDLGTDLQDPIVRIVFLGDSLLLGTGATKLEGTIAYQVAQEFVRRNRYVEVVNRAVSRARAADLVGEQTKGLWGDVFIILIGSNDSSHFTPWSRYMRDWHRLIAALKQCYPELVLVASSTDVSCAPALPRWFASLVRRRCRRDNQTLRILVEEQGFYYVDLFRYGKLLYIEDPALYAADKFHPSDKGYARLTDVFLKVLRQALDEQRKDSA